MISRCLQRAGKAAGTTWVPALAISATAGSVPLFWDLTSFRSWGLVSIALVLLTVTLLASGRVIGHADWFHPMSFPVLYYAFVLLVPAGYILWTQASLGLVSPSRVEPRLVLLLILSVICLSIGAALPLLRPLGPPVSPPSRAFSVKARKWMLGTGRSLLAALIGIRVVLMLTTSRLAYGQMQTVYDTESAISTMVNGLIFISVVLVVVGSIYRPTGFLLRTDILLIALFATLTLTAGSRAPLIAPAIFLGWSYSTHVKRVSGPMVVLATAVAISAFQFVGESRTQGFRSFPAPAGAFSENTLRPLNSPLMITADLLERVPSEHGYMYGSTYWAAIKRQLPGPISRSVWGPLDDTGAYAYRQVMHYDDPNQGWGFALVAEAFLNLGPLGVYVVSAGVGLLFGWSWRSSRDHPQYGRHLLYPILVSIWPYGVRSDALTHIKLALYPLIVVAIMFAWIRWRTETRGRMCRAAHSAPG